MKVKDTGQRTKFDTGSQKEIVKGKGRFDLLPLKAIIDMLDYIYEDHSYYKYISKFLSNIYFSLIEPEVDAKVRILQNAYIVFIEDILISNQFDILPKLAKLYELGADKYEARDWEKGRPMEVFINSILRHFVQYMNDEDDEDHATAVSWNLLSLIDTLRRMPSMSYTLVERVD